MSGNNVQTVLVVGGGLVGSLCAIFMAKRGYHVMIFEYRDDIRCAKIARGRSINMALSNRGRNALRAVNLEDLILELAIPMKGRFLHDSNGQTMSVPYDAITGQCLYSINRNHLIKTLLTGRILEFEKYPNSKICFNQKLITVNFEEETITLLNVKTQELETHHGDLIIGADGAFSTLRRFMQSTPMFELKQKYIDHGYLELKIPPKNGHKMAPNHLHIWPRQEFMMIALPNIDNSWTVTLFMPFSKFHSLKNSDHLIKFFKKTFPDAIFLLGEGSLVEDFFKTKPSPLISIQCSPYHIGKKFLIIGDAAHAMVPFYGQGMNAGFEDCFIFDRILTKNKNDIPTSIQEYSLTRKKDTYAICELAIHHYEEMKSLVTTRSYHLRKKFDDILFKLFPHVWVPLYNSVTFTDMGYHTCIENREWQNEIIQKMIWSGIVIFGLVVAYLFNFLWK